MLLLPALNAILLKCIIRLLLYLLLRLTIILICQDLCFYYFDCYLPLVALMGYLHLNFITVWYCILNIGRFGFDLLYLISSSTNRVFLLDFSITNLVYSLAIFLISSLIYENLLRQIFVYS